MVSVAGVLTALLSGTQKITSSMLRTCPKNASTNCQKNNFFFMRMSGEIKIRINLIFCRKNDYPLKSIFQSKSGNKVK